MSKQTIEVDVPEGKELVQFIDNYSGVLTICFKDKKEPVVKDFSWYIEEYFKQSQIYDRELAAMYVVDLFQEKYDKVPFEMKIGLLKFIANSFQISVDKLVYILYYSNLAVLNTDNRPYRKETEEINSIVPQQFLNSILL